MTNVYDLVIRNADVVTASDRFRCDIGVRDGRIVALGHDLPSAAREIDATGLLALPGGVDGHCHLDQPMPDGMRMADLSTQTRVISITRPGTPVRLHPRRGARLSAGDTAYLVGPYRELLDTLRKGQGAQRPDVSTGPATTG